LNLTYNPFKITLATPSIMMNLYEPGILKHALQLFIRSMSSSMGEQLDNLVEDLYTSQRPTERARFLP
jgi:hypothetical protein